MFGRMLIRCLQTPAGVAVEKAALLELRKKTGYTFSNCKKALQLSDNDVGKAERWLHQQAQEQGWAKASQVTGRARGQGLVAVHRDGPFAAMAEVNCETDFVARTEDFRAFVDKLVRACTSHAKRLPPLETGVTRVSLASAEVEKLKVRNGGAVGEARALLVGRLGEDVAVRRVLCLRAEAALLAGFCHGDQAPQSYPCFGKYGALVTYRALSECMLSEEELEQLGRGLCQQVVGMRPSSVGLLEDFLQEQEKAQEKAQKDAQKDAQDNNEDTVSGVLSSDMGEGFLTYRDEGEEKDREEEEEKEEKRLLFQDYVLDPDMKVGTLVANSQIDIMDFERFECGEPLD
ncbi:unnamed protein product [Ixodes hexagonus]